MRRKLDHPKHQSDPGRIVDTGLALERRARAARRSRADQAPRTSPLGRSAPEQPRSTPASVQSKPSAKCANTATTAAVANVPSTPNERIGTGGSAEPSPANVHAAVEQDHDQRHDRDPLDGQDRHEPGTARPESETTAAATRKIAGAGTGKRPVSVVETTASATAPVTRRRMAAKSVISVMATTRRPDFPAHLHLSYTVNVFPSGFGRTGSEEGTALQMRSGRVKVRARPARPPVTKGGSRPRSALGKIAKLELFETETFQAEDVKVFWKELVQQRALAKPERRPPSWRPPLCSTPRTPGDGAPSGGSFRHSPGVGVFGVPPPTRTTPSAWSGRGFAWSRVPRSSSRSPASPCA